MIRESRAPKQTDQPIAGAPLWRRIAEVAPELGGEWRPVHGGGPQPEPTAEPTAMGEAEIVEDGGDLRIHDLGEPAESRFGFFLDGIEYTRICGYVGTVP